MLSLLVGFYYQFKNTIYSIIAIFSFFSLHFYGFVKILPKELIPLFDVAFTTSFFLTFIMFFSFFALLYRIALMWLSNVGKISYGLIILIYKVILRTDIRGNRPKLYSLQRAIANFNKRLSRKFAHFSAIFVFFILFFSLYGKLTVDIILSISMYVIIFVGLYIVIFRDDVKLFISFMRNQGISDALILRSAERAAPFIVIVLLFLAMLMGMSRAARLVEQNPVTVEAGDVTMSKVVFGTTSSGYILYDKEQDMFFFLTNNGEIIVFGEREPA